MNKKILLILLITLLLATPIAYTTRGNKNTQTKKVIVITGTIGPPETKYINKANSYAGMEHWLVPLALHDKNLNKLEDKLETKILEAKEKDIEVVIAAAYGDLDAAINIFEQMGGKITKIYRATASFRGTIAADKISILANKPEIGWIQRLLRFTGRYAP